MKLLVIGTGYVGLVTGTCFAEMGHTVTCLDIDANKIEQLNNGEVPIYEPGLKELIEKNQTRLTFTTSYKEALSSVDVCFIAVPTTPAEDGSCDLSYVFAACDAIKEHLSHNLLIVNKSTAPPNTVKEISRYFADFPHKISVVSNPEFLKEGSALADCLKPDRIIIGSDDPESTTIMKELYAPFSFNHDRIIVMSSTSAELTKYAANTMLASRISLMNELSRICDETDANINDVRIGIGSDQRIGYQFLYAGAGYGGSCFPKDIKALKKLAQSLEIATPMLDAIESVNEEQKKLLSQKISHHFKDLEGKKIAIWGLSFKPDTDDIREAPALQLIEDLLKRNAHVKLYDPISMEHVKKVFPPSERVTYAHSEYDAASEADAIALVTEWKQFRFVNLSELGELMKNKVFFDGRNQYKPANLKDLGFAYYGIGT